VSVRVAVEEPIREPFRHLRCERENVDLMRLIRSTIISTVVAAAALAAIGPSAPSSAQTMKMHANPIKVTQCFIIQPKMLSKNAGGTQIDYVNEGKQAATSITFAVAYRNAQSHFLRKVVDTGTFEPGAPVQHRFDLYNDVTYAGKQTQACQAVAITWANGSKWVAAP
jgi:hypothetical protein